MQRKHAFRVIPGLFGNIRKSGNILGGDFYRTWTVKLMNYACTSAGKVSFTIQIQLKFLTPNIPRFANVISNTSRMTRKTSFPCIKYLVFQIYSLKFFPVLLASNLHCAHKTSSGLGKSDFSSIKQETRSKLFLCFGLVYDFLTKWIATYVLESKTWHFCIIFKKLDTRGKLTENCKSV